MIDYEAHAQLGSEEVTLLWIHEYCDMPLSGILEHGGALFFYELADGTPGVPRYAVRALTSAQQAEEARWLPLYRRHVEGKPLAEWSMFYAAYNARANPIDYACLPIVACSSLRSSSRLLPWCDLP